MSPSENYNPFSPGCRPPEIIIRSLRVRPPEVIIRSLRVVALQKLKSAPPSGHFAGITRQGWGQLFTRHCQTDLAIRNIHLDLRRIELNRTYTLFYWLTFDYWLIFQLHFQIFLMIFQLYFQDKQTTQTFTHTIHKRQKQLSIKSEKHNIWWALSLLFRHWKKINWNRLINKHWDWHPTGESRSLYY